MSDESGPAWGLGTGVDVEAVEPWMRPGRWGWNSGTGITAHVDASRGTVAALLTQREMTGPQDAARDVWAAMAPARPRLRWRSPAGAGRPRTGRAATG